MHHTNAYWWNEFIRNMQLPYWKQPFSVELWKSEQKLLWDKKKVRFVSDQEKITTLTVKIGYATTFFSFLKVNKWDWSVILACNSIVKDKALSARLLSKKKGGVSWINKQIDSKLDGNSKKEFESNLMDLAWVSMLWSGSATLLLQLPAASTITIATP